MKKNPWKGLGESRKFWLLVLDVAISTILYFTAKYAGESVFADVKYLILALQPVFATIINAIAKEDAALKGNGSYIHVLNAMNAEKGEKCCE